MIDCEEKKTCTSLKPRNMYLCHKWKIQSMVTQNQQSFLKKTANLVIVNGLYFYASKDT